MSALLLRLGGPLQSWGTHSTWNERDTENVPTRSGLIGLIAAARGEPRTADLDQYRPLQMLVRVDRPGNTLIDFHTVGGGRPAGSTVPTASGKYRPEGKGTLVSRRHYLADAVFTVALTSPDAALLDTIETALRRPHWAPYLGRRACPPDGPFLLARVDDPATWLHEKLPLARSPHGAGTTVAVDFASDRPPEEHDGRIDEPPDDPVAFASTRRAYRTRAVYRYRRRLSTSLCAGYGVNYLTALTHALED
ncbi:MULTISPECIES: type I-E CRISPR-associated protein Cas5/CasD [unclassified Saccharopolyspora]|uniref:type I-E CRISPR-associated protein Cas5/CasD n=1 Tax=unclassified Saccharopolyspora TaxID=2646250 RepID=UPI001CD69D1C|nr:MULTISPECIES: type I-E CRISPR-associated protein Cas5/CasD [unclassified Saccharopolyspora]MCA1188775.1 type I-E CRISPR-associated protein Cas5/CasD [Saccharopolyspora sp. 6T]MCA1283267.1 type I-E CRISPR-associated protein Cas5/CasD [Saccharopolyspora sp. 7B]